MLGCNLRSRRCYVSIAFASLLLAAGELTAMAWLAPAQAAGNGNIAPVSTGNLQLRVQKNPSVHAAVAADMVMQPAATDETTLIWVGEVYVSTSRASGYDVTALGGGADGGFVLTGGDAEIPLEVSWKEAGGAHDGAAVPLTPGVPVAVKPDAGAVRAGSPCRSGRFCNPAQLIVAIPARPTAAMKDISFSQSLTLLIAMN